MDHVDGHTPDLDVAATVQFKRGISAVRRFQSQSPSMTNQPFEREGSVEHGDHHAPRSRIQAAIHHEKVAIVDAGPEHGVAAHPQKERAGGVMDQLFIQIDPHFHIVVSRRGEAGCDPFTGQRQGQPRSLGQQGNWRMVLFHVRQHMALVRLYCNEVCCGCLCGSSQAGNLKSRLFGLFYCYSTG